HDPRPDSDYWPTCAAACTTRQPNCRNVIRSSTTKLAYCQPIPQPSHKITNANQRSPCQAPFTPLLGRHLRPAAPGSALLTGAGQAQLAALLVSEPDSTIEVGV